MEAQYALKTGKLVSLSESQIVDCDLKDARCTGAKISFAVCWATTDGGGGGGRTAVAALLIWRAVSFSAVVFAR